MDHISRMVLGKSRSVGMLHRQNMLYGRPKPDEKKVTLGEGRNQITAKDKKQEIHFFVAKNHNKEGFKARVLFNF